MCYAAKKDLNVCYAANVATECNYYPAAKKYAIVNNSDQPQTTDFYDINGKFISYMDTSRLVAQRIDRLIGKCVVVRGHLVKIDGNSVLRADAIRLKR